MDDRPWEVLGVSQPKPPPPPNNPTLGHPKTPARQPMWNPHADEHVTRDAVDGVRALEHAAVDFDASYTTPARCRAACASEGYDLAAVEYGHECCKSLAPSPGADER